MKKVLNQKDRDTCATIKKKMYFLGAKCHSMNCIEEILKEHYKHNKDVEIKYKKIYGRAKMSDYNDEYLKYNNNYEIIGIEVDNDNIDVYEYTSISQFSKDDDYNRKSSIRIICDMLSIDKSKYKLAITNDEDNIFGLLDLKDKNKCSIRDIKKIRIKDLKAQGIAYPKLKYNKTARSLKKNNADNYRDTIIIKSKSNVHSITIDALLLNIDNKTNKSLKNILLYNYAQKYSSRLYEYELCLYSKKKITERDIEFFNNTINSQFSSVKNIEIEFYNANHFVGTKIICKKDGIAISALDESMYLIRNNLANNPFALKENQALHIFSFPFKWDCCVNDKYSKKTPLEKRWNIDTIDKALKDGNWQIDENMNLIYDDSDVFALDSDIAYNEFSYFYPNAREAIFDANKDKKNFVRNYRKSNLGDNAKYIIDVPSYQGVELKPFYLELFDIRLKIYSTGVGILSFFTKSRFESNEDRFIKKETDVYDKLNIINEFGRRVYPQFIKDGLKDTKKVFLANSISIDLGNGNDIISENFKYTSIYTKSGNVIGKHILEAFGNKGFKCLPIKKERFDKSDIHITPVIDDRMHVSCYTFDDSEILKNISVNNNDKNKSIAEKRIANTQYYNELIINKTLYNHIFLEPDGPTCQSDIMLKKMLENSIYTRWINYGTLYAFSDYSFIALVHSVFDEAKELYPTHFCTTYYEMMCLCLMQNATINSFEEEVTRISLNKNYSSEQVSQVSERFIQFNSSLYFRQVTAQEQGKEMYEQIQNIMNIEKNLNELRRDIEDLQNAASLKESKSTNNALSLLAVIGGMFTLPNFFVGLLGTLGKEENLLWCSSPIAQRFYLYIIPLFLGIVAIIIYIRLNKKARKAASIFIFVLAILMLLYMLFIVFNAPIIESISSFINYVS